MMLSTFIVLGYVAIFTIPTLGCRPKEYTTRDGQCCPKCHEGNAVQSDCTPQAGTKCTPCDNGTFMNQPNGQGKCLPCSFCDQGHGLVAQQECTATSDTRCGVLTGYFCSSFAEDAGCSSAVKHSRCDAGQRIKEPGTSRNDTVCEPCKPGYFSKDGVNCTAWTKCSEAQVKLKEGSTSSDVVCGSASRSHYCSMFVVLLFTVVALVITARLTSKKSANQIDVRPGTGCHHKPQISTNWWRCKKTQCQ